MMRSYARQRFRGLHALARPAAEGRGSPTQAAARPSLVTAATQRAASAVLPLAVDALSRVGQGKEGGFFKALLQSDKLEATLGGARGWLHKQCVTSK